VSTVSTILGLLLIAACAGSALMDFRKPATLVASMQKLKVPEKKLPLLGAIKLVAAVGIAAGFQKVRIGEVAGLGLCAYFAIATLTHIRVKDAIKDTLPAFALLVMSMLYVLTSVAK
jgi:hypothetical protein